MNDRQIFGIDGGNRKEDAVKDKMRGKDEK